MSSKTIPERFGAPRALKEVCTLTGLLRLRAHGEAERTAYTFLADGEREEVALTYGGLDARARAVAARLQSLKADGGRVLLLYPSGLEYVAAFFGCLYAGAVAVPAYPPKLNRHLPRVQTIVADAGAEVALTTAAVLARMKRLFDQAPGLRRLRWLTTDELGDDAAADWREPSAAGDDLALLQYTSGSTSSAKGVMVTHENLLRSERMIQRAFGQTAESVTVGWLPLYHDMGLIGNVLQPLYTGTPCVLMSPTSFLQRPARWLEAVTRYRATTSGGPNFAYELCAERVGAEERARLDLSSWGVAYNGSEPVRADTLEKFARAFAPCGFRREAFLPCYGLAEATLLVSGSRRATGPLVKTFEAEALERHQANEATASGDGHGGNDSGNGVGVGNSGVGVRPLVGCGEPAPGQRVVIADPETGEACGPGRVGEVWVSGPNVARGYWNRPEESAEVFGARLAGTQEGPFLRTGDLGFLSGGELFVTGRLKDLIIIRGLNHYPQDIEHTVGHSHAALRAGGGAAFSVEAGGAERLVVVQELGQRRCPDLASVVEAIRQAVAEEHEIELYGVAIVKTGELPKTSSGKLRRRACRAQYLAGGFDALAEWRAGDAPAAAAAACAPKPTPPTERTAEAVQEWLRAQCAARLGVEASRVDPAQPLARYGLDSLAAIELAHGLETHLGVSLSLSDFLRSPSIAELAALAAAPPPAPAAPPKDIRVQADSAAAAYPLSQNQQSIWFMHQLAPERAAYNVARAVRIRSPLDVRALGAAFQKLTDRHASLRTTFQALRGAPVQWVHDAAEARFIAEDASHWDQARLDARLNEEQARAFDLERGPLMRVTVFSRAPDEHVLLLVAHHIIIDFWSLAVLLRELGRLYSAECAGGEANLPPLARQYTDYVSWQEDMLAGAEGERLWQYWRGQLSGELPLLDLHTDRPRPAVQTYRGASLHFTVPPELVRRVEALGRAHGATLYMTLLAAFNILLRRHAGQTELVVGSPTTGRGRAEFAGVAGYFVNPVALRAKLPAGQTFGALLGQVRQTVLSAFEHQDYPFAQLVERLQPARDPGRSPLFQAMFILQKAPSLDGQDLASFAVGGSGARIEWAGHTLEPVELRQQTAQFDLTLTLAQTDGGLIASFEYNTDLFDRSTVGHMAGHFQNLLRAVADAPEEPVSALPLLTDEERRRTLYEWNDTRRDYPSTLCVHQLFEQQAARTPQTVALECAGERLTYAELDARADGLARRLRSLGVGPEARVAVMLERSAELVVSLLGVLKAGGAYVPLDPEYPPERLAFMLEDSGAEVLLTDPELSARLPPQAAARTVCLDSGGVNLAGGGGEGGEHSGGDAEDLAGAGVTPENLAYVIYTSGSTGRPKGVAVTHRNVVRLVCAQEYADFGPEQTFLLLAPTCFDASTFELWGALLHGARLAVMPPGAPSFDDLARALERHRVTTLWLTSGLFQQVVEHRAGALSGVRQLLSGGDVISPAHAARYLRECSGGRLVNGYGPTEATTFTCCGEVSRAEAERGGALPLGRPVANTRVYVLDDHLQPVPAGAAGELYIGGDGLARGYLNRAGLTAERFLPDPFSPEPGARLYRTGDVCRHLPDGRLEFAGRLDEQVKVRGFRVELGEIEAVLARHASVREAAVVARGEGAQKRLVAYVVCEGGRARGEGGAASGAELRRYLAGRLPEHMLPSPFVILDALPLTPNGKVDRRALPEPSRPESSEEYVEPRTAAERVVAAVWREVLGVERVGLHDDFFELGGHSLLATQVISHIREVFRVELPLRRLFERPTVHSLVAAMSGAGGGGEVIEAIAQTFLEIEQFSEDEVKTILLGQSVPD